MLHFKYKSHVIGWRFPPTGSLIRFNKSSMSECAWPGLVWPGSTWLSSFWISPASSEASSACATQVECYCLPDGCQRKMWCLSERCERRIPARKATASKCKELCRRRQQPPTGRTCRHACGERHPAGQSTGLLRVAESSVSFPIGCKLHFKEVQKKEEEEEVYISIDISLN